MRTTGVAVAMLVALLLSPLQGQGAEVIGVVRLLSGTATVQRAQEDVPVTVGFRLFEGDALSTGPGSSLGAMMRDNASLSMGPSSTLSLARFRFSPLQKEYSFLVRVAKGTLAYVSGLIGKSSPDSVRFETPVATLAIRGTHFAVKVDE
jgi:hypothetical protein